MGKEISGTGMDQNVIGRSVIPYHRPSIKNDIMRIFVKFKNKVVLVTGGGTALGRAMGLQFAREGAPVIVNYSKSKERAKEVVDRIDAEGGRQPTFRPMFPVTSRRGS